MKLNAKSSLNAQSSSSDTHQFQISANGTAFQILSSGLYSNKAGAVLRELGCNAADAHVAAGIAKTPIVVNLPTTSSQELSIRDYGLGLNHEQVLSLYTTYFSSDKRDSNAFVGGLGLGSKSPFAYTDSFTVSSINAGVKRLYTCNIGSDGAPTVTRLHEEHTTEHSGMEIKLLIQPQDIQLFHREAVNMFQWFETRPTFNIQLNEFVNRNVFRFECPSYAIGTNTNMVKMGNVAYPLSVRELNLTDSIWMSLIQGIPLLLKSPIGHLQVAASREALQYDPDTKKNLVQLYQQAYNDIARRLVAAMMDVKNTNTWEQECALKLWVDKNLGHVNNKLLVDLLNQHSNAPEYIRAANLIASAHPKLPAYTGNVKNANVYWYAEKATGRKTVVNGYVSVGANKMAAYLPRTHLTTIVIADGKNINDKITQWRKEQGQPTMLLISPVGKAGFASAKEHAEKVSKELGGVPVRLLSEMPLSSNIIISPQSKKSYVEVEDREVEVWDFFKNEMMTMRFGDVPENMRHVLIRDTAGTNRHEDMYLGLDVNSKAVMGSSNLRTWSFYLNFVAKKKLMWAGPTGAIILRPVDVARLKIVEAGIPWLLDSMATALEHPKNKAAVEYGSNLYTKDKLLPSYYKLANKLESGWLGDLAVLLAKSPNKMKCNAVYSILKEANIDADVAARQNNVGPDEDNAWQGYDTLIINVLAARPDMAGKLKPPLSNQMRNAAFNAKFPLMRHVYSNVLEEYLSGTSVPNLKDSQVLNLLRVCLNLPVEV